MDEINLLQIFADTCMPPSISRSNDIDFLLDVNDSNDDIVVSTTDTTDDETTDDDTITSFTLTPSECFDHTTLKTSEHHSSCPIGHHLISSTSPPLCCQPSATSDTDDVNEMWLLLTCAIDAERLVFDRLLRRLCTVADDLSAMLTRMRDEKSALRAAIDAEIECMVEFRSVCTADVMLGLSFQEFRR